MFQCLEIMCGNIIVSYIYYCHNSKFLLGTERRKRLNFGLKALFGQKMRQKDGKLMVAVLTMKGKQL